MEWVLYKTGVIALGLIKKAFVTKSEGGTDEAGERWRPLSPRTIAYRKSNRNRRELARDPRPSQALTKKQSERWWDLYRQGMRIFRGDKSHAARRAWFILKSEGATTLLDKYASAQVRILHDTGELLNSFEVRVENGDIVISNSRRGASSHHKGTGHVPQRRLCPDPSGWPQSWWDEIVDSIKSGLIEVINKEIRGE